MRPSERKVFVVLCTIIGAYLFLRILNVPLVHDECATYFFCVEPGKWFPFYAHWDANNHALNSFLAIISTRIFGVHAWSLRLPNWLFFSVFCYYLYRLSQFIKKRTLRWGLILSFLFSSYIIEFYGLSRGYGISIALLFGGIFYFVRYIRLSNGWHLFISLLLISLATLANMTFLQLLLLTFAAAVLKEVHCTIFQKQRFRWLHGVVLLLSVVPIVFFTDYGFALKNHGALYYGSKKGFWDVTVLSQLKIMTNGHLFLGQILLIAFLLFTGVAIWISRKKLLAYQKNPLAAFVLFLLAGNFLITLVLAHFFKVNFPEDRTGISFLLLFLWLLFLSADMANTIKPKAIFQFPLLLSIMVLGIFSRQVNLDHSTLWKDNHLPFKYIETIRADHSRSPYPPIVAGRALEVLTFGVQNLFSGGQLNQLEGVGYSSRLSDYVIVWPSDSIDWGKDYDTLRVDPASRLMLLKRKAFIQPGVTLIDKKISFEDTTGKRTYFNFCDIDADSLQNHPLLIYLNLSFSSPGKPFNAQVVISAFDKKGQNLSYQFNALNWSKTSYSGRKGNFRKIMYVPFLPAKTAKLVVYVWNTNSQKYSVEGTFAINEVIDPLDEKPQKDIDTRRDH